MPAEGGLTWVRVTLFGRQAHAGWRFHELWPQPPNDDRPLPGVNAIELAVRFLGALREFEAARRRNCRHPLMPPGLATINPGVIRGGAGLGADGNPVVMTRAAMIPDVATIDLDYKFMRQERFTDVQREFEQAPEGLRRSRHVAENMTDDGLGMGCNPVLVWRRPKRTMWVSAQPSRRKYAPERRQRSRAGCRGRRAQ